MRRTFTVLASLCIMISAFAQENTPIKLYPQGVPNSKSSASYSEIIETGRVGKVTDPTLTPFFPAKGKANGTAVVVCPGGGYARLAIEHEGYAVAKKFAEAGVTAFVLKYRLPSDEIMADKSIGPLQDAQRAIQIVRQRAAEWKINPDRVGIIGFSAGGHLASTAITHFDKVVIDNKAGISLRPDFGMLIYPVITFGDKTHKGSKLNLIGAAPTQEMTDLYSNQKQVTANTPPTFIVQAQDDKTVPVENSLLMYEALLKAGVKTEMHLYPAGGHGFGLNNKTTKDMWFDRCINWMDANGWMTTK